MTHLQFPPPVQPAPDLLAFAGEPLLAQLLARRSITSAAEAEAFLTPEAYRPAPPDVLPDMAAAIARLSRAIERQEQICVWGDFDVDGQTSTALLVSMLRDLGGQACYYIPNRLTESHGIKLPALERHLAKGIDLLLTCDTGIAEHAALEAAQAAGVDVIVTDHHDLADSLPPATAIINPKRLPADHPLRELPGVGVAYKVAQALYQAHGQPQAGEPLLDLVALGIVADIARQSGDTRYLLQRGLRVLQNTPRTGLHALLESANLKTSRLTEDHIGFWLAPRLNALGRLGDANLAVELLTTDDLSRSRILALQLEALNDRRKLLVDRVVVQALSQIEDTPSLAEYNAIVLAAADWHPGVIGIAASRLVEQYRKPVILIALRPDGQGRGSARSVAGCNIHQAIKTQAHLLHHFGGHPMAAGISMAPENVASFRRGLSEALSDCRVAEEKRITLDLVIDLPQISGDLLATIQRLAPFGAGNPPVKLGCTGLHVVEASTFGKTGAHKRLLVEDEAGRRQSVIWWRGAAERTPQGKFDLAFTLSPDDFRGGGAVQVEWVAAREWVPPSPTTALKLLDWRQASNPLEQLAAPAAGGALVWAEGVTSALPAALPRHKLSAASSLVIWSAPPGQDIFQRAINRVLPQAVLLVAQPSPFDALPAFIKQLMGLVKYALSQKEGEVHLTELAGALGHRVATVQLGIDWLAAQGKLSIYVEEDDLLVLRPANLPPDPAQVEAVTKILGATLAETAAYRAFFRAASLATIKKMIDAALLAG